MKSIFLTLIIFSALPALACAELSVVRFEAAKGMVWTTGEAHGVGLACGVDKVYKIHLLQGFQQEGASEAQLQILADGFDKRSAETLSKMQLNMGKQPCTEKNLQSIEYFYNLHKSYMQNLFGITVK
jgi:hypothetical protein